VQTICLLADIRAFGKCMLFGVWIFEFVRFGSGYCQCFDLIPGSRAARWRINSTDTVAEETPNCDGEVSVVSVLKFCCSF
jgi:hypothetical protein